ncbi:MAG: DUF1302 domain-containing protein [Alcanivorax sp.]|nr:DUF1302 domain-containing protein [Alcanivorax sp.]
MRSKLTAAGYGSALLLGVLSSPAMAGGTHQFNDDLSVKWNLKASVGAISRTESANKDHLFAGDTPGGTARSAVSDDGNLNYEAGEVVSAVAKAVGDINLQYRNYGLFVRGKGWYNYIKDHKDVPHGNYANGFEPNTPLSDDGFARNSRFQGVTLQDAYVYGKFQVNDQPLTLRAGRQTLLWGRSLYSRGSFSSLNAIDLAALHRPGAEYTEYLIPAGMITADYSISDRLGLKSFYQYEWRAATLDGCGTFFSTLDNTAKGCDATFSSAVTIPNQVALQNGIYIARSDDKEPKNGGQYGLKLDYSFPKAKVKVGTYFLNYHMRLPMYSVRKETTPVPGIAPPFNGLTDFYEYPEDIQVFGLTADKTFAGIGNLAMNLSYLPDMPIQINTSDLTTAAITGTSGGAIPQGTVDYTNSFGPGDEVTGYQKFDIQRAEFTFTTIVPQLLGAKKTIVSLQMASEFIPDLPDQSQMRFRRHTNYGVGAPGESGYVTDFSWGYQLTLKSTYANAIGPVSLSPSLTLRQGVEGYSSDDALQEDQRSLGLGVGMAWKKLSANLSYTTYNDAKYSVVSDRDYVSLSTSYAF